MWNYLNVTLKQHEGARYELVPSEILLAIGKVSHRMSIATVVIVTEVSEPN